MARPQAWWRETPRLAQDPPRDRRENAGDPGCPLPGRRFAKQICREERSPRAISVANWVCPTCWTRSRRRLRSAVSPQTAPTILANARHHCRPQRPCRYPAPQECQAMEDRRSRCRSPERGPASIKISGPRPPAPPLGSILRMRLPGNGWSDYHCRSRVETRMHCVNRRSAKRNCWARGSWHGTSTVRSRNSKSGSPC
jgi:hypothetical protein